MGNEAPTAAIRSATTNELGLVEATAHSTMDSHLAVAVRNNETTPDRRAQLLAAVESVARGDRRESNSNEIEISPRRTYKPIILRWNDEERSIVVDLCVYNVVNVEGKVDVHCALAYTMVKISSPG